MVEGNETCCDMAGGGKDWKGGTRRGVCAECFTPYRPREDVSCIEDDAAVRVSYFGELGDIP